MAVAVRWPYGVCLLVWSSVDGAAVSLEAWRAGWHEMTPTGPSGSEV